MSIVDELINNTSVTSNRSLQRLQSFDSLSKLDGKPHYLRLSWNDIQIRNVLGIGCFSTVYQVSTQQGSMMLPNMKCSLALKCIDPAKITSTDDLASNASDLVVEADILSSLDHPNIIKLHGVCSSSVSESFHENEKGYFLLLEILQNGTVRDYIKTKQKVSLQQEKEQQQRSCRNLFSSMITNPFNKKRNKRKQAQHAHSVVRRIALGIAKGMQYIHEEDIILRDLKPDNIGFDDFGNVKIFDFGLARYVNDFDPNEIAGTLRYMSPESMMGRCSGRPSDVYSFGILLWELCTLRQPYSSPSRQRRKKDSPSLSSSTSETEFKFLVAYQHYRPSMEGISDGRVCNLIEKCWDPDPECRPSFLEITSTLQDILLHPLQF